MPISDRANFAVLNELAFLKTIKPKIDSISADNMILRVEYLSSIKPENGTMLYH